METTLTVPAAFVADLRSGLFCEWGFAAENLSNLALTFGSRSEEVYESPLRAFEAARTFLGAVSWRDQSVESDTEIDIGLYPALVLRALQSQYEALVDRLGEVAGTPIPEDAYLAIVTHAEGLREFITSVETRVEQIIGEQSADDAIATQRLLPKSGPFSV
jgi:hypothetical protein